jgi:carbamoyltransferase
MITWGISANSHDAAVAVFDNQQLVFASHSERFSGTKNDPNLNHSLISYARQWGNPELVCWYENPLLKSIRQLYAGQGITFAENNVKQYLKRYDIDCDVKTQSHHRSHAAAGYYTSEFDDACVIVIDAIGEFQTLTVWSALGNTLTPVHTTRYPHSLGIWYSAMTQRCKLRPNEEEYILMGMAALGNRDRLYKSIKHDFIKSAWPFKLARNLHRGIGNWRPDLCSQQDLYDIAAATQRIYEELFSSILYHAKTLVNSKNLVLMGGCALNCVANSLAYDRFKNVWIMPNPGDAGSSIGAVLSEWSTHIKWPGPMLGKDMGYSASNETIVDYLVEHKICAVARGKAEFGPRALGNRSILADPRGNDVKDRVNIIKKRELFRPFAPAILEEHVHDYFVMPCATSPYMQTVAKCKTPEKFPAIVHYDNTSRVQTVGKNDNPQFRKLLEIWYAKTGCPMLLNTSLNIKGQAMVNDIVDAGRWTQNYGLPVFT